MQKSILSTNDFWFVGEDLSLGRFGAGGRFSGQNAFTRLQITAANIHQTVVLKGAPLKANAPETTRQVTAADRHKILTSPSRFNIPLNYRPGCRQSKEKRGRQI